MNKFVSLLSRTKEMLCEDGCAKCGRKNGFNLRYNHQYNMVLAKCSCGLTMSFETVKSLKSITKSQHEQRTKLGLALCKEAFNEN